MKDAPDTRAELAARALRHLARREHSRAELARKLAPHAESKTALAALLDFLASTKQLSDERYAEERARWLARKYGAARIQHDLRTKGVDATLIERLAPSDELATARAALERKYRTPATTREERARRARFLQGRGFGYEIIRAALSAGDD